MDVLSNVLLTWLNGIITFGQAILSPITMAVIVVLLGFLVCARYEVAELDRQGAKPVIGNH